MGWLFAQNKRFFPRTNVFLCKIIVLICLTFIKRTIFCLPRFWCCCCCHHKIKCFRSDGNAFVRLSLFCLPNRKQISQYLNIPNESTNQHTYPRTHMRTLQTQTHPDQTRATKTLNGNEKDKDWCLCLFIYFLYLNLLVSIRSEWHWMAIFWCSSVVNISQR